MRSDDYRSGRIRLLPFLMRDNAEYGVRIVLSECPKSS